MITINLLPDEFRKTARTPLKMMAAVSGAVLVNTLLVAWWCWMSFGVAAEIETQRNVLQLEMDGLTPQVNYHDALGKEVAFHSSRESTLASITSSRVQWTRVIDDLVDVVHAGGDGIDHYIWFDDVSVKQEAPRGPARGGIQSFGTLKCNGHSGAPEWNQVPAFLEDIADTELTTLMASFHPPAAPEGNVNDSDQGLIPAINWSFPLTLELRSPQERALINAVMPEGK
ncbi:MAG: hypothetical protein O2816_04850 [Planctomycetota bacterium]|nr:hypothetical protein [Planctomycetota bacterium]